MKKDTKNNQALYKQIIRILIGAVFIYSAATKLLSFDAFEMYIYSFGLLSLNSTFVLARLLVGFEMFLGAWLITGLYRKKAIILTLASLAAFTLFILYLLLGNNEEHCHCFGEAIEMSHYASIAKNIALGALLALVCKGRSGTFRFALPILAALALGSTALPFILSPPDSWVHSRYVGKSSYNEAMLEAYIQEHHLQRGKHLLCFYGTGCRFCKLSARKIEVLKKKSANPQLISYHFWGTDESVQSFTKETHTQLDAYNLLDGSRFLKITDGKMPLIILLNNGEVIQKYGYRDYQEDVTRAFLQTP